MYMYILPMQSNYDTQVPNQDILFRTITDEGFLFLQVMRSAAQKFVGDHDFRNFCRVCTIRATIINGYKFWRFWKIVDLAGITLLAILKF